MSWTPLSLSKGRIISKGSTQRHKTTISLLHLHYPLHGAIFVDEQHQGVFTAREIILMSSPSFPLQRGKARKLISLLEEGLREVTNKLTYNKSLLHLHYPFHCAIFVDEQLQGVFTAREIILMSSPSFPLQRGKARKLISLLEEGLREVTNKLTYNKSLLHLHYPLHGAIFVDEQHQGVFTAREIILMSSPSFPLQRGKARKLISLLEEGLREVTNKLTYNKSLLHLHYPFHGAIFVDEQHQGVFTAREIILMSSPSFPLQRGKARKLISLLEEGSPRRKGR
jgi:CBS domain-containing protein